jgi:hypothetical protein
VKFASLPCVRRLLATLLLTAGAASAGQGWLVRPSVGAGGAWLFPSKAGQYSSDSQRALQVEVTVELGGAFAGVTWIHGLGDLLPDQSFLGVKLGYVLTDAWASPYASLGIGKLSQTVLFPFDAGTPQSGSGPGFALEAGAVLFRRAGLGRAWIYGFALLPTFDVRLSYVPARSVTLRTAGFGLRLAL